MMDDDSGDEAGAAEDVRDAGSMRICPDSKARRRACLLCSLIKVRVVSCGTHAARTCARG